MFVKNKNIRKKFVKKSKKVIAKFSICDTMYNEEIWKFSKFMTIKNMKGE